MQIISNNGFNLNIFGIKSEKFSTINTKFIKFLIKVKKPTQRVKKDVFSLVPVVPFDRIWTDENVFDYFNLLPRGTLF